MRLVLVNAPPHGFQEPRYDRPLFPRPALAVLAATARRAGIDVSCVDAKLSRLDFAATVEQVVAARPEVVGLTAFTNEIKSVARVATAVKQRLPEATIVVGGVHLTAIPEQTMREFPVIEIGAIGQGDETIVDLVHAIGAGDVTGVAGIIYRQDDDLVRTPPRPEPSMDTLPMPAWDLLPRASRYRLMTARGCPFACNFCANPNGRIVRRRTIEQAMDELGDVLDRYAPDDPQNIWWDDEIFTVDMKRTEAMCDAMIERGYHRRARWVAQTHVNVVSEALFRKMKAAGCIRIGLGIESADETVLKGMGKGSTIERAAQACRWAEAAGLPVESFFILGHPNETLRSARNTIDFAVKINPEMPIFGIMVPYPGTKVGDMALKGEGGYRVIDPDWNVWNKQIGGAMEFEDLSRFQLEWLQTSGYLKVYWKNRRYRDLAKFVWTYRREAGVVLRKWARGAVR